MKLSTHSMDNKFHPTFHNGCNYLSIMELKFNHVSKRGSWPLSMIMLFSVLVAYIMHHCIKFRLRYKEECASRHGKRYWYNDVQQSTVKPLIQAVPNPQTQMFLVSSCSCLHPIDLSHVLSREWRCSWSSADRRCSNYIWLINKYILLLSWDLV